MNPVRRRTLSGGGSKVTILLPIVRQVRIRVVCALASTKMTLIAKVDLCWLTMTGLSAMKKTVVSGAMSSVMVATFMCNLSVCVCIAESVIVVKVDVAATNNFSRARETASPFRRLSSGHLYRMRYHHP